MTAKTKGGEKQGYTITMTNKTAYAITLIIILAITGPIAYHLFMPQDQGNSQTKENTLRVEDLAVIQPVSAQEIGGMFVCPCCGNPIAKLCCPMAKERMTYVEALVDSGMSKTDVIASMVKKYGLTAMMEGERAAFRQELEKNAPEDRPKITINPTEYDFGDVSVASGVVTTQMTVANEGAKDLVINRLETSCGCTSAALIVDGVEGPRFGMSGHGKQPQGWSARIPPGGSAQLKIYYDPKVHPNMRGKGTRTIDVASNDPIDITKQVKIEFNQIS